MINSILSPFYELGKTLLFLNTIIKTGLTTPCTRYTFFEQIWKVFAQSFSTTALAGFFVGAIMSVQFTLQVKSFGALGFLGGLATSGTIRELGPLLIAFMLSGKIGAFTAAELGTMRVTEQIDAIKCLGANPIQEIILPRFVAIIVSSFFLLVIGLFMSIFGGVLLAVTFSGINFEEYFRHIPTLLAVNSLFIGLLKCFSFALVLATICTYKGYHASGGSKGVGKSVVQTAVLTMVCIVIADWMTSVFATAILELVKG